MRETPLGLSGVEWNPVEKKLVPGNPQQETAIAGRGKPVLEFVPRDFKLSLCAFVIETVQADILHQNVQTMNKCARRFGAGWVGASGEDGRTPAIYFPNKGIAEGTRMRVTEVIARRRTDSTEKPGWLARFILASG